MRALISRIEKKTPLTAAFVAEEIMGGGRYLVELVLGDPTKDEPPEFAPRQGENHGGRGESVVRAGIAAVRYQWDVLGGGDNPTRIFGVTAIVTQEVVDQLVQLARHGSSYHSRNRAAELATNLGTATEAAVENPPRVVEKRAKASPVVS